MKKSKLFIGALLLHSFLALPFANAQQTPKCTPGHFLAGELLVKFKSGTFAGSGLKSATNADLDKALKQIGAHDVRLVTTSKEPIGGLKAGRVVSMPAIHKVSFDTTVSVADATQRLKNLDCVELVAPNYRYQLAALPKDPQKNPLFDIQNNVKETNIEALWNVPVKNTKRPVIAIVDTGVDSNHADLKDNMWKNEAEANGLPGVDDDGNGFVDDVYGYNFALNSSDITDVVGHGTHCAGVAAAVNNNIGVVGMNPDALVMGLRVFDDDKLMTSENLVAAVDYAVKNGADVVSMSLGGYKNSEVVEACMNEASNYCLLVAAAGNNGFSSNCAPFFPSAYSSVLGVEGLKDLNNYDDDGPYFNANGFGYQVKAPTVDIVSTTKGAYEAQSGTSMATPCVAGIASRLLQCKDYDNWDVLKHDLINACGLDYIDAYKAYQGVDYSKAKVELGAYKYEVKKNEDGVIQIYFYPTVLNIAVPVSNVVVTVSGATKGVSPSTQKIASLDAGAVGEFTEPFVLTGAGVKVGTNEYKYSISLKADGVNLVGKELIFALPDSLLDYKESDGNVEWKGKMKVKSNFHLHEGDTLFIRPGANIEIEDAKLLMEGVVIAKGEQNNPINISGVIFSFNSKSVVENVNFTGDAPCSFVGCTIKNSSFKNMSCSGFFAKDCVFEHCSFISVSAYYFEEDCKFYNCNLLYNRFGYSISTDEEAKYALNPSHLFNCNTFNNFFGRYKTGFSLLYYSTEADTVSMGSPCYLGDETYTPINERVLDANNPNGVGHGVVNVSDRLSKATSEAPALAYKVFADSTDLLGNSTILLPYYVENLEVHFNRAMNVSLLPDFIVDCEVKNAHWENEYLFKASVIFRSKADLEETSLLDGFYDVEGQKVDVHTEINHYVCEPAGSDKLGLKGRYIAGQVNLTWESVGGNIEGYNLYRCTETEFLANTTKGEKLNQQLLPAEQLSYTDKIVSTVSEVSYVYCLTKVLSDGEELQVHNWVCVRYSKDSDDENISDDALATDCEVYYSFNGTVDMIGFIGKDISELEYPCYDLNGDESLDVLDFVLYKNQLNGQQPSVAVQSATYSVINGVLYINTPVDVAALQIQFSSKSSDFEYMEVLSDMERSITKVGDDEYRLVVYSFADAYIPKGTHPLLKLNDTFQVNQLLLCSFGEWNNGNEEGGEDGGASEETKKMQLHYYNFLGREVSPATAKNVPGVYIVSAYIDGKFYKAVKFITKRK